MAEISAYPAQAAAALAAGCRALADWLWGPLGLAALAGAGLYLTLRSRAFVQRRPGLWLGAAASALGRGQGRAPGELSGFQSMCTALAATVGTGNLVGVAAAIYFGGPGAVFWMWVMAFLGMSTRYVEDVLGILYRRRAPDGGWLGGPMYYLRDGVGGPAGRALAALFAGCCVLAALGMGNMSQANAIAENLQAACGLPRPAAGLALAVLGGAVLLGGARRVAAVTQRLVPFMALGYIAAALAALLLLRDRVPAALGAIFRGAFGLQAAAGGAVGQGLSRAVAWGLRRGAFSNEAGLGSAVLAHSCAHVDAAPRQGLLGVFEVFVDTHVLCTLTALVVLASGVVDLATGHPAPGTDLGPGTLVAAAFGAALGPAAPWLVTAAVGLLAFSTLLGWGQYGAAAFGYLTGGRAAWLYPALYPLCTLAGALAPLTPVWAFADAANGLMLLPNLAGVLALSGQAWQATAAWLRGRPQRARPRG